LCEKEEEVEEKGKGEMKYTGRQKVNKRGREKGEGKRRPMKK